MGSLISKPGEETMEEKNDKKKYSLYITPQTHHQATQRCRGRGRAGAEVDGGEEWQTLSELNEMNHGKPWEG